MAYKSDKPAYFVVGTAVSAKYRGAYCSAVIQEVNRRVNVRIQFDRPELGMQLLSEEAITGDLFQGNDVEVKLPNDEVVHRGTVIQVIDNSVYTVVYDDGDISCLRRSQICIPRGRHFRDIDSLDAFPLMSPEAFSKAVKKPPITPRSEGTGNHSGTINAPRIPDLMDPNGNLVGFRVPEVPLVPANLVVPEAVPLRPPILQRIPRLLKGVRKTRRRFKRKFKKSNAKVVAKKNFKLKPNLSLQPKPSTSTIAVAERVDNVNPAAPPGNNDDDDRLFFYWYTPPERLEEPPPAPPTVSCSKKRKAFLPKKVIKMPPLKSFARGKENQESTPGPINTASPDLGSRETNSNNQASNQVGLDLTIVKQEPAEPSANPSPSSSAQVQPYIQPRDNSSKKPRSSGDNNRGSTGSKKDGTTKKATTALSSDENSRSVNSLYAELVSICMDIDIPSSPPIGKRFNFIPNIESIKDPNLRQKLISDSLTAVVVQYFTTKKLLNELQEKNEKKETQDK